MTLPRILSAVGRTLAVLGVVMLLFVVFQLWGTGLQQARAQSNLAGDLAERVRLAAEAGQAGPRSAPVPPNAPESPAVAEGAATADAPAPDLAALDPPDEPADLLAASGRAAEPAVTEGETTDGAVEPTDGTPSPPSGRLPELPSLPRVVGHISETASARAVARLLHPDVEEMLPLVYPDAGEAIARIIIPSIDVDEVVVAGVEVDDLRKGPGHYSATPLPGQPGNAAIAGHRTTYGAPFGRIDGLSAGDTIIVETLQGRFDYRVLPGQPGMAGHDLGFRIVAPTALEVLDDVGDNRLTLTSCHPKYSSRQRIVVHAALVGDPVVRLPRPDEPTGAEYIQLASPEDPPPAPLSVSPPPAREPELATPEVNAQEPGSPPPGVDESDPASGNPGTLAGDAAESEVPPADEADPIPSAAATETSRSQQGARQAPAPQPPVSEAGFGEGLSGDRGAVLPAVLWGLAAAATWGLGWFFGRLGRRSLRYTVAAVPFLVVLYVMFSYVDRALPAY
ncbi:MAG: sortase [Acidimicrobiia bacterium]|nr:sortase [Acidimicrobiia bacterium]MYJ14296.1 sortase [Acidimicrobiia bacterium]